MTGSLTRGYTGELVQNLIASVSSGNVVLYGMASNPNPTGDPSGRVSNVSSASFDWQSNTVWNSIFGKKIQASDMKMVVRNVAWKTGTVYTQYDDQNTNLFDEDFYVVYGTAHSTRHVYKCIYNNGGVPSTSPPTLIQSPTFYTADGYGWRYMYTVTSMQYDQFATAEYVPVTINAAAQSAASSYAGVDVVEVSNGGVGYACYTAGLVQGFANSTALQIQDDSSGSAGFYSKDNVYLSDSLSGFAQLLPIADYAINSTGSWLTLGAPANTDNIVPGRTLYNIHPAVVFDCDGSASPQAYSVVNSTSNSIQSIVVIDNGVDVTRASAYIQSNSSFGYGAVVRPIAPPPNGHASDPATELGVQGMVMSFYYNGSETLTIPTNVSYDRISIIQDPQKMDDTGAMTSGTFTQYAEVVVDPLTTFAVGDVLIGQTSGARGTVAFSNIAVTWLTGDKNFAAAEKVSNGSATVTLSTINTRGDVDPRSMKVLYVRNVVPVSRTADQIESFRLTIAPPA